MTRSRILLVEDTPSILAMLAAMLRRADYDVTTAQSAVEARAIFPQYHPNVILLDLRLPDGDGLELMQEFLTSDPTATAIAITADGSVDRAVQAMRAGAFDFLVKPINEHHLITIVEKASEAHRNTDSYAKAEQSLSTSELLVGSSDAMQDILLTVESVARSDASVFITGESGTGKSLCAEAIHNLSSRSSHNFVPLNCGAIPTDLMESEVFGHIKGAFPSASYDRSGAVGSADGGTLFLDNIDELDFSFQAKLLKVLETSTVRAVGAHVARPVDVRIICATGRDPHEEIMNGRLRDDLFYRLHVIPIHMPALRDRGNDVNTIAEKALLAFSKSEDKSFHTLSKEVKSLFCDLPWPGNVRQLLNVLWNVVVLNEGPVVTRKMLPQDIYRDATRTVIPRNRPRDAALQPTDFGGKTLAEIERTIIESTLHKHGGSVPKAARELDVSPSTLYRKLESWGVGTVVR